MKSKQRQGIAGAIGKKHAFSILTAVENEPKRFKELETLVPNKRTLSNRLRELKRYNLLEKTLVKKGRGYLAYQATKKAKRILEVLN